MSDSLFADLQLVPGYQSHKATSPEDSVFHGALADTAPDAWGRRVTARNHARQRKLNPMLPALTELDYLLAVDDFSRLGALRLRDPENRWLADSQDGQRRAPPLLEPKLSKMLRDQFRGISETKMLNCLTRLGRDVEIVVGPAARRSVPAGRVAVVFAA